MISHFVSVYTLVLSITLLTNPSNVFALVGGEKDIDENNGIIQIIAMDNSACTATKIDIDLILTAAHCITEGDKIAFSTKTYNPNFEYEKLEIVSTEIHPSFFQISDETNYGETLQIYDVAIIKIKLTEPFKNIPIAQMDFNNVSPQDTVNFYGYGCQESLKKLDNYIPCKKHIITNTLSKEALNLDHGLQNDILQILSKVIYKNNIITNGLNSDSSSASLCLGDSGGPILRDGKVVGINTLYTFNDMEVSGESSSGITFLNLHLRLEVIQNWASKATQSLNSSK